MKNIILLIAVLFTGACATTPTVKSVAGIYENSGTGGPWKLLIIQNGEWVQNQEGKPDVWKGHWEIVNGEIRITHKVPKKNDGHIAVFRINPDGSISQIAWLIEGKRSEIPRDKQASYKKLN